VSCFKPTRDDWYPSYGCCAGEGIDNAQFPHKLVRVVLHLWPAPSGRVRVSVWGADDTGMERDFDGEFAARTVWETILAHEFVSKHELTRLGFVHA
jgi:hypothetical protein